MKIATVIYVFLSLVILQTSKAQENPVGSLPPEIPGYYRPDPNSSFGEVMYIKPSPGVEDGGLTPVVADKLIREQFFSISGATFVLSNDVMYASNPSVPVNYGPTEILNIHASGDTLEFKTATYMAEEGSGGIIRYANQANQMGQIVFFVEYVTLSRLSFFERSFLVATKREFFIKQNSTAPEEYQYSSTITYQAYIHPTTNDVQLAVDTIAFYARIGRESEYGYGRGPEKAYMIEKNQIFGNLDSSVYTRHMFYDVNPDTSILQYASFSKFDYLEGIGTADTIKQTFYSRTFDSSIADEMNNVNRPNFSYAPADFVENPNHRFEEMRIYTQVFDASLRFSTYQNRVYYRKNLTDELDGATIPFNLEIAVKITYDGKVHVHENFSGVNNELQLSGKTINWYKFENINSRIDSMKYWHVSNGNLILSLTRVAYPLNETTDSVVTYNSDGMNLIMRYYQVKEYATAYPTSFPIRETVSTKETDFAPQEFELSQNYPNPFNPSTRIAFNLPQSEHVILEVFDITGKKLATLVNEQRSSGQHLVSMDASRWSSGVYVYRLQAGNRIQTRKMLLVK